MTSRYSFNRFCDHNDIKRDSDTKYDTRRNHGTCKSVGIDTSSMTCYLYNDRVYAGLNGTNNSNIIYYWLLESECPIQLGYREDSHSKICSLYNDTNLTWLEAQIQCQQEGGFLFMVDTRASQMVLHDYFVSGAECPIQLGYKEDSHSKICSLYNDTILTWLEAQIQCQQEGGFLFMADTRASQMVLQHYSVSGDLGAFTSLGATDMYDEDVWEWFNGVPIDRSHFAPDDPNNYGNTEHCLFYSTALIDYQCDIFKCGFICQIPTIQTYLPSAGTV
ncbi:hypothetical protein LOTGIDRAFT_168979 [Lottia gigantea]|uniref:C-type lectin domain-containing protein n=1 Tax=Lottia gigantea TaxID=225164 RepID=V3YZU3_LOTGI|nr:hypothetical protein LOTGIDRAFT_168979 [Lottia gigantea]ESO83738.1 hypothetical protein LOTGIDRAFT_168979 [Lottia gigantea]